MCISSNFKFQLSLNWHLNIIKVCTTVQDAKWIFIVSKQQYMLLHLSTISWLLSKLVYAFTQWCVLCKEAANIHLIWRASILWSSHLQQGSEGHQSYDLPTYSKVLKGINLMIFPLTARFWRASILWSSHLQQAH